MREPALNDASFPTAHCQRCDKIVLTCIGLDDAGNERRHCVHCDAEVEAELRWASADELEADGYYFGRAPEKTGGACGSGCGSCSVRRN